MYPVLIQTVTTLIVSICNYLMGFSVGWCSAALVVLSSDASPFKVPISTSEANYIASLPMLGGIISTIVTGIITDYFGRKRTLLLSGIVSSLGWTTIYTSKTVIQLLIGRFSLGLANGLAGGVVLTFVSEIAQASVSGTLASALLAFYSIGLLSSYITGWLMSYDAVNCLSLCTGVVFVLAAVWLKETPAFLLANGREKEALASLKFYRAEKITTPELLEELEYIRSQNVSTSEDTELRAQLDMNKTEKEIILAENKEKGVVETMSPWKVLRTTKHVQRALVVTVSCVSLAVLMGTIAIQTYAGQMFMTAVPSLSPYICSIMLASTNVLGGILSVCLTGLTGRRPLSISTSICCSVGFLLIGTILRWAWAPAVTVPLLMLLVSVFFQVGPGVLPFVQLSECFSPQMKSLVTTVSLSVMWLSNFVVLATFGPIVENMGLDGAFFIFGAIAMIIVVVHYLFMKETKGVPLEQIQAMYAQGFLYRRHVMTRVTT